MHHVHESSILTRPLQAKLMWSLTSCMIFGPVQKLKGGWPLLTINTVRNFCQFSSIHLYKQCQNIKK